LLGFRDGKTFFYLDAEPSGSPDYSPPGEIWKKEPSELLRCFLKGEKLVAGPYQDKWGRWVTAFVPLKDFDTQQISAVLGIDMSAAKMRAYIFEYRLLGVLFTLVIFVLLVGFFIVFQLKGIASIEINKQLHFLQQLLDAIPVPVFYRDVGGAYLGCNKAFEEFIGKPKEQIIGKSVYELYPKEVSDVFRHADWQLFIKPFQRQVYETYVQRADGLRIYVVFNNAVYIDTRGDPAGVVGVIMDITERRKAEEALLLSESKFKTLFESSRDAIMLLVPEKGFISGNPATIEMFRCNDEKEFTSYSPADLSPEYQPDGLSSLIKAQQMIAIAMEKGSNYFEWIHKRRDGEEFFATVLLTRMELEGKMLLQATVRDITEHKKAQDSIKQAAEEWQHTFDSITDFIFVMDTESRIIKANEAFIKAFGGNPGNILGKKCFEVVHKSDSRFPNCPFPHTLEAKEVNTVEVDDPGLGITLLVTTSPMLDAAGNIIGVVHIAKDISELKRVQKVIQEALDMKSQFISMASHELRTPLTAIKESINIVSEEADSVLNPEQKQFLDIAKRNLDRLSRLINDILSFQKLEAHKVDFNMQSYNINEVIKEVRSTMEPLARQKGLEFSLALAENLPHISFDKDNITQVLINLINNAIKFTDKGKITVSTEKGDNTIAVAVCDTGRGIKKEDLPKLFQQFQQVGSAHERKTGGTGLGLAISKQIIGQHRGKIWAESEAGAGARFIFLLPIQERRKRVIDA